MPIYEFHCQPCEFTFEDLVRSSTESVSCPKCSGEVKRLLSACVSHVAGGSASSSASSSKSSGGCGGCHGGSCSSCH
jgi:putative FmdB family regulatory protein